MIKFWWKLNKKIVTAINQIAILFAEFLFKRYGKISSGKNILFSNNLGQNNMYQFWTQYFCSILLASWIYFRIQIGLKVSHSPGFEHDCEHFASDALTIWPNLLDFHSFHVINITSQVGWGENNDHNCVGGVLGNSTGESKRKWRWQLVTNLA